MDYDIPKNVEQCRAKLREEFDKNRHIKDIRVIDMLVIKVIAHHLSNIIDPSYAFNDGCNEFLYISGSNGVEGNGRNLETEDAYYELL